MGKKWTIRESHFSGILCLNLKRAPILGEQIEYIQRFSSQFRLITGAFASADGMADRHKYLGSDQVGVAASAGQTSCKS